MAEDIIDILVTNYNDNVTLELDPAVTVVNISNLSGLTGIIIPSGTVGRLPYYDTASTFADSGIYTSGTIVGINNDTPTLYSTNKGMVVRNPAGNTELLLQHDGNTANSIQGLSISTVKADAAYIFQRENLPLKIGTNDTSRIFITGGGNVLVNSSTDAGYKLDVNGTFRATGAATFSSSVTAGGEIVGTRFGGTSSATNYLNGPLEHLNGTLAYWYNVGSVVYHSIQNDAGVLQFKYNGGSPYLSISTSGIATFSSSVTTTQFRLSALNTAPSSASDTGTLGEVRIDTSYIYVCTATNTWKRSAITTW